MNYTVNNLLTENISNLLTKNFNNLLTENINNHTKIKIHPFKKVYKLIKQTKESNNLMNQKLYNLNEKIVLFYDIINFLSEINNKNLDILREKIIYFQTEYERLRQDISINNFKAKYDLIAYFIEINKDFIDKIDSITKTFRNKNKNKNQKYSDLLESLRISKNKIKNIYKIKTFNENNTWLTSPLYILNKSLDELKLEYKLFENVRDKLYLFEIKILELRNSNNKTYKNLQKKYEKLQTKEWRKISISKYNEQISQMKGEYDNLKIKIDNLELKLYNLSLFIIDVEKFSGLYNEIIKLKSPGNNTNKNGTNSTHSLTNTNGSNIGNNRSNI